MTGCILTTPLARSTPAAASTAASIWTRSRLLCEPAGDASYAGGNEDNPIVVNCTVYAGTNDGHVVALRP